MIEITSLRGNPDGRLTTNYSFNMGITTRGRRGVEMMDTDEKLELERLLQNASTPDIATVKIIIGSITLPIPISIK